MAQTQNNIHDSFFKQIFKVKSNLKDFLKSSLPKQLVNGFDLNSIDFDDTEYTDKTQSKYMSDIAFNLYHNKSKIKIAVILEHKSRPDKYIRLQILRYMLNVWERQKADKVALSPVLPIVFYHGKQEWAMPGLLENSHPDFEAYTPQFKAEFITPDEDNNHTQKKYKNNSVVYTAVLMLKYCHKMKTVLTKSKDLRSLVFSMVKNIKNTDALTKIFVYLQKITEYEDKEILNIMAQVAPQTVDAIEHALLMRDRKAMNRGIEQGIEQEKEATAAEMIRAGLADTTVKKCTKLTLTRIKQLRRKYAK